MVKTHTQTRVGLGTQDRRPVITCFNKLPTHASDTPLAQRGTGSENLITGNICRRHSTLVSAVSSGGTWRRDSRARRFACREGSHRRTSPCPGRRGSRSLTRTHG